MVKIVALINPTSLKQEFCLIKDNTMVKRETPKVQEMIDTVFNFIKEFPEIEEIDLLGSKQYNAGFRRRLMAFEKEKFGKNKLNIKLL